MFGDIPMDAVYDQMEFERKQKLKKNKKIKESIQKYKSFALFNQVFIDTGLEKKFKQILPDYTYYGINITTPLRPQVKVDEWEGLCVTWSAMYMLYDY